MAVPKKRHTKSRRDKRRGNIFLSGAPVTACPRCGAETRAHALCWNCGHYRGKEVVDVLKDLDKKARKEKEEELLK